MAWSLDVSPQQLIESMDQSSIMSVPYVVRERLSSRVTNAESPCVQFSKKMFDTLYDGVFPLVNSKYPDKVQFIFRQQIQPWHPSSTLVHEAGAAVLQMKPDTFWDFSKALFDKQTEYFDANVVHESRNATYERLAKLAGSVGVEEKKIYSLLEISDKPDKDGSTNTGNGVTNDIKLMVKVGTEANVTKGRH